MVANQPFASAPIELVQEQEGQRATVLYVPVVRPGDGRLVGVVTLAFRADDVLHQVRPRGAEGLRIRWEDATGAGEWLAGPDVPLDGRIGTATVDGFGRTWTLVTEVDRTSLPLTTRGAPWVTAVLGVTLTLAVLWVLSNNARWRRRAEELAEDRGRELRAQAVDLERANAELRDLDAVKDRVLRSVTHDLRGPLTVILGMTDLLGRADLDRERRALLLERVQHQAARLDRMVDELATASQLDAGRLRPQPTDLELVTLVERAVQDLGPGRSSPRWSRPPPAPTGHTWSGSWSTCCATHNATATRRSRRR